MLDFESKTAETEESNAITIYNCLKRGKVLLWQVFLSEAGGVNERGQKCTKDTQGAKKWVEIIPLLDDSNIPGR